MMNNEGGGPPGIEYNAEMMRYFTIKLNSRIADLTVVPFNFSIIDVGIRKCTIEDQISEDQKK